MWLIPLGQLKLVKGASPADAPTTLTDQDIANIKIATREAVWQAVIDGSYTAEQCMRIQDSALAGIVSGLVDGDSNPVFKSLDGLTDRITVISDRFGNRTSIVIDIS